MPSGVPAARLARKMSPVEILGTDRCAAMNSACVPFPAPGGPTRTNLMGPPPLLSPLQLARFAEPAPLTKEPFVVALHQLALDLLHGLQAHADDDQHGGAAEREVLLLPTDEVDE